MSHDPYIPPQEIEHPLSYAMSIDQLIELSKRLRDSNTSITQEERNMLAQWLDETVREAQTMIGWETSQ